VVAGCVALMGGIGVLAYYRGLAGFLAAVVISLSPLVAGYTYERGRDCSAPNECWGVAVGFLTTIVLAWATSLSALIGMLIRVWRDRRKERLHRTE
jgi:hypothetical protein